MILDDKITLDYDKFNLEGKWLELQIELPKYLKKHGLDNFRNSTNNALRGFGADDLDPIDLLNSQKKLKKLEKFLMLTKNKKFFRKLYDRITYLNVQVTLKQKLESLFLFAKYYGIANNAKPIESLSDSLVGNPKNYIKINENFYTFPLLRYYIHYAQTCNLIDYSKISSILEIGGGFGMQMEIFKKLYPHLEIILVDLPSNVNLQKKYLKKQFPDLDGITFTTPDYIESHDSDILWNSMSFQVMHKDTAFNYLETINHNTKKFVCLHNKIDNKNSKNHSVTKQEYIQKLNNFNLIYSDSSAGQFLHSHQNLFNLIFQKNN